MADTPSWLSEDAPSSTLASAPAPSAPSPLEISGNNAAGSMLKSSKAVKAAAASSSAAASSAPVDESDLPNIILVMRLANLGSVTALVVVSIMKMVTLPGPSTWVLSVYATLGGLLVCGLETQLKFLRVAIAMNFGFLFSPGFRFMFYMLLATLAWTFNNLFGYIVAIAMATVALLNTYVLLRYPSYRAMRERIAEEEDKKIQAKIQSEVKKQAIRSLSTA